MQGSDYETILDSSNHSESSIKISNTSAVTIQDLAILNGRNAGIAITRSDHILLSGLMIDQARSFGVLILRASACVRKSLIRSTSLKLGNFRGSVCSLQLAFQFRVIVFKWKRQENPPIFHAIKEGVGVDLD